MGIELAGLVIGSLLAGYYADKHFGTSPWLSLLGITLGSFAGLWAVIKASQAAADAAEDKD